MTAQTPKLTPEQWEFLAVFDALKQPLSITLAGELAPLAPGPFLELLRLAEQQGWLIPTEQDTYGLAPELPEPIKIKLDSVNTPEKLSRLVQRLDRRRLKKKFPAAGISSLIRRSGQPLRAAEFEYALAGEARQEGRLSEAASHLENCLEVLASFENQPAAESLLISVSLELSDLRLCLGKGQINTPPMLRRARKTAVRLGDRRSKALIDLHLGRYSFVTDNLSDALEALDSGLDEVNDLGDEDIIAQSAGFAGLYYFLQGLYKDAVKHYDRAMASRRRTADPTAGFFTELTAGFCSAYLGQFHRAVGVLNRSQQFYRNSGNHSLAALFEAGLGVVLLLMGREDKAHDLLTTAMENSRRHGNHQAWLISQIGQAHLLLIAGRLREAGDLMAESILKSAASGHIIRNYIFPFVIEDLYACEILQARTHPTLGFHEEMNRLIDGPNIHLRGTAYRLRAQIGHKNSADITEIRSDLETSLRLLKRSGDPLEQAKTTAVLAGLELKSGHHQRAAEMARAAWPLLAPFGDYYFPLELKAFVGSRPAASRKTQTGAALMNRFLDILEELAPSTDLDEMLTRLVMASCRYHEAERGGLFWFSGKYGDEKPQFRASFNLTAEEVESGAFKTGLKMVVQAFQKNSPVWTEPGAPTGQSPETGPAAVFCLPVAIRGRVRGVFYHDNGFLGQPFELPDLKTLEKIAGRLSSHVERLWEYHRVMTGNSLQEKGPSLAAPSPDHEITGESPVMKKMMAQADKVAGSEASVLLLGETGVGKELAARRIHRLSARADGPFVVVDMTAIPETLTESELFGHEKGSFTGADRQKSGRLELADKGTVFLDEVGEIPLNIQTKLLRVLQEKTFTRVGGAKNIYTDFRLVAATNRDLEAEVAAGRFREDLFYRLNVIPINIPPLRQRGADILLLARTFLDHYARKHNRPHLDLSREDEERLLSYHWPGNVRELKNVIERAVLVSTPDRLELFLPSPAGQAPSVDQFEDLPTMDELQVRYIKYILEKTEGRIAGPQGAAALLGMKRGTLYTRMKKLGLDTNNRKE